MTDNWKLAKNIYVLDFVKNAENVIKSKVLPRSDREVLEDYVDRLKKGKITLSHYRAISDIIADDGDT